MSRFIFDLFFEDFECRLIVGKKFVLVTIVGEHTNFHLYATDVVLIEIDNVGGYFAVLDFGGGGSDHGKNTTRYPWGAQEKNELK